MAVDVFERVAQLAARVDRGSEEVLGLLEDGPQRRVLEAAVRAALHGQAIEVEGLAGAFSRYDELRARIRRVGGRGGASPAPKSDGRVAGRRSTRRHVPRSGRS